MSSGTGGAPAVAVIASDEIGQAPRREIADRLLSRLLPASAVVSRRCLRCGRDGHGPVRVEGAPWLAGVSYTARRVVAVVVPVDGIVSIAVDAEELRDARRERTGMEGVLGHGSHPDLRAWTRVEAAVKADGRGIAVVDPASVTIAAANPSVWTGSLPGVHRPIFGWDTDLIVGAIVSVAMTTAGEGRPELLLRTATE